MAVGVPASVPPRAVTRGAVRRGAGHDTGVEQTVTARATADGEGHHAPELHGPAGVAEPLQQLVQVAWHVHQRQPEPEPAREASGQLRRLRVDEARHRPNLRWHCGRRAGRQRPAAHTGRRTPREVHQLACYPSGLGADTVRSL